ncbi:transcriptional regulator [Acidaminobacter sp.]|uniref:transcriptional regulator n=1 Tax=Acidaminobacter sp. TaxID=1872102 RepID=UPI00255EB958|nr:transcriptional regulator [Acidaminobacter sp.]MDK9712339.1 transcriptional regulator [Acidaminobacter sp.]
MKTVIGVITTLPHKSYLEKLAKEFQDLCQMKFFVPETLQDIDVLYEQNKYDVDAFILSGTFIYEAIEKEHLMAQLPIRVLKDDEGSIYKGLLKIILSNPGIDTRRIYIDFANRIDSFDEFKDRFCPPIYPVSLNDSIYEQTRLLLKNHIELWENGQIDFSITAYGHFVPELTSRGNKFLFLTPTLETVRELIRSLLDEVKIQKLNNRKMVVGRISIEPDEHQEVNPSPLAAIAAVSDDVEDEIASLKIKLKDFFKMQKLVDTSQRIEDYVQLEMPYEAYLSLSDHLQSCALLTYLQRTTSNMVKIGWGSGREYFQARENAEKANRQAKAYRGSCSFFVSDDQKVTGPLDRSGTITFKEMANDEIIELSERLGIHNINLQKIISYAAILGTNKLSSEDVANCLSITVRGANRILNQIEAKAYAGIIHEKRENTKGRPKKYYEMTFIDGQGNYIS